MPMNNTPSRLVKMDESPTNRLYLTPTCNSNGALREIQPTASLYRTPTTTMLNSSHGYTQPSVVTVLSARRKAKRRRLQQEEEGIGESVLKRAVSLQLPISQLPPPTIPQSPPPPIIDSMKMCDQTMQTDTTTTLEQFCQTMQIDATTTVEQLCQTELPSSIEIDDILIG